MLQQSGLLILSGQKHRSKEVGANSKTLLLPSLGPGQSQRLEEEGSIRRLFGERNCRYNGGSCLRAGQVIWAKKGLDLPQHTRNWEVKTGKYET